VRLEATIHVHRFRKTVVPALLLVKLIARNLFYRE
jgi:hypothetical protein